MHLISVRGLDPLLRKYIVISVPCYCSVLLESALELYREVEVRVTRDVVVGTSVRGDHWRNCGRKGEE